jgi:hypothetical protein
MVIKVLVAIDQLLLAQDYHELTRFALAWIIPEFIRAIEGGKGFHTELTEIGAEKTERFRDVLRALCDQVAP